MIVIDGKYVCARCGVQIEVASGQRPLVVIKASGGKPNMRVVRLGDEELHAPS